MNPLGRAWAVVVAGFWVLSWNSWNVWAADTVSPPAATQAAPPPAGQPVSSSASTSVPSAPTTNASTPPKPPFSILFTPDEMSAIEQAFVDRDHPSSAQVAAQAQAAAINEEALRPRIPNIYVSAVLDFGGGEWTVWANGLRVTPDQQSPLFKVVSVRGNTVDISVTSDGGTRISLQPYQTWRSRQRDVVEGIFP